MGFNFRKNVKIMPGVKLNITKKELVVFLWVRMVHELTWGKRERKLLLVYRAVVYHIQVIHQGIRKPLTREVSNHRKREQASALSI